MLKKSLKLLLVLVMLHSSLCTAQLILPQLFSGNGGVLNTNSAGVPSITATPTLGVGATTTGKITFQNSTNNNTATIQPGASASNLAWTLPTTDSTGTQCLSSNGSGTLAWANCSGAGLSAITAATATNTIANGNNTGQVWNWASTTDATTAMTFGETSAATNGTTTGGFANQVLLSAETLPASTQSAFQVKIRGNVAMQASTNTTQMLFASGGSGQPGIAFGADNTSGLRLIATGRMAVTSGGALAIDLQSGVGNYFQDFGIGSQTNTGTTISFGNSANEIVFTTNTVESSRYGTAFTRFSKASADAVAYALNSRKARGSVASPTVITAGDDLLTINGAGYVGGTNTYRNAATVTFTSTGTISDAANGIGGHIKLSTQKQGTDTSPQERARVDQLGHLVSIAGTANTPSMGACGTSPSVAGTDNAMLIVVGTGGAASSCAVTFGSTWAGNAPVCVAQNDTDIVAYKVAATTTGMTITASAAFTASSKFNVICLGQQ